MVDTIFRLKQILEVEDLDKVYALKNILIEIIDDVELEKNKLSNGEMSKWNYQQLQNIILPEMKELLSYAMNGKVYFKYGRKQRLLESTYLLTDSLEHLNKTSLGQKVLKLQQLLNSIIK